LEENVTRDALTSLFIPFGDVQEVNLPLDEKSRMNI
jgi:hypothetical protein